jgi:apolipoprotein D and lipocalin family protein
MRLIASLMLTACILLTAGESVADSPIATAPHVDLARFMGPWYVIASIPSFLEKDAYNAVESYSLNGDGTIATTFTFHKGAFDGKLKTMRPHGFVVDHHSNATWDMQFLWPFKAQYLIAYLDDAYTQTIIARNARDYVWIMARKPTLEPAVYQSLVDRVGRLGYDTAKLRRVPQLWPDPAPSP